MRRWKTLFSRVFLSNSTIESSDTNRKHIIVGPRLIYWCTVYQFYILEAYVIERMFGLWKNIICIDTVITKLSVLIIETDNFLTQLFYEEFIIELILFLIYCIRFTRKLYLKKKKKKNLFISEEHHKQHKRFQCLTF